MRKKIIRREYSKTALAMLHDIHPLLQRIYAARSVKSLQEIDKNFEQLHPFETFKDIDKAVQLLAHAITHNERILIVGDFDADGATSTAVAIRALKSFGVQDVEYLVPNRFADGYGLTPELVEASKKFAPALIVTVDNGIANHAGVTAAKNAGIKVLVTDHHLPAKTLPDADAIVNPNQYDDPFPSKCLAGVGVIFYVMVAVRRYLTEIDWFQTKKITPPIMSRLLDIVALGTIADLVPLDHNNRILVHQGLRRIRAGQCIPAIPALLELADKDLTRIAASDLGFAVAARLNAAGRLDDMSLGIECLLTDDPIRAREIARTLDQLNDERKSIEQEMQAQALDSLNQLTTKMNTDLPRGLCLYDSTWHQGVIGILAARIKDRFHRPVIVFADGNADELKGSARSIAGFHIRDALQLLNANHPDLILKFGGHAMAAGLTIKRADLKRFTQLFDDVVTAEISEAALKHSLISDGELNHEELTLEIASMLREAGPWGQAFPEPLFDDQFRIVEQRLVGDKHLKLRLAKEDKIIEAVSFFVDTNEWPNHRCQSVHAAFRLDVNEYKGKRSVQLIVDYLEPIDG